MVHKAPEREADTALNDGQWQWIWINQGSPAKNILKYLAIVSQEGNYRYNS